MNPSVFSFSMEHTIGVDSVNGLHILAIKFYLIRCCEKKGKRSVGLEGHLSLSNIIFSPEFQESCRL